MAPLLSRSSSQSEELSLSPWSSLATRSPSPRTAPPLPEEREAPRIAVAEPEPSRDAAAKVAHRDVEERGLRKIVGAPAHARAVVAVAYTGSAGEDEPPARCAEAQLEAVLVAHWQVRPARCFL